MSRSPNEYAAAGRRLPATLRELRRTPANQRSDWPTVGSGTEESSPSRTMDLAAAWFTSPHGTASHDELHAERDGATPSLARSMQFRMRLDASHVVTRANERGCAKCTRHGAIDLDRVHAAERSDRSRARQFIEHRGTPVWHDEHASINADGELATCPACFVSVIEVRWSLYRERAAA